MDPNMTLREIRDARNDLESAMDRGSYRDAAERLSQHIEALDRWLTQGGFLPNQWFQGREIAGRNQS